MPMDTVIAYEDITFETDSPKTIRAQFYKRFYFTVATEDFRRIGEFTISKGQVIFKDVTEEKAWHKMGMILQKGFDELRSPNGKQAIYIHQNSGIPLIGNGSFGIIDRGSNLIEIKPITGCNIDCIYCSVDESKRNVDFIVEKDYMVKGLLETIAVKGSDDIEVHIGVQGEPLLYAPLAELIRDINHITEVKRISMDTNATMLTEKKVDELLKAGLTSFNISINAIDEKTAETIAGSPYKIDKVLKIARYIADKGPHLLIAPILIPKTNEQEMKKIIEFCQSLPGEVRIGIQNFLNYRFGRNPVKQISFEQFYESLKKLEQETGASLLMGPEDFSIQKTKELPKPFRKNQKVTAEIVCPGRLRGEMIAVAENRCITVTTEKKKGRIDLIITRTKHNIFYGKAV
jgi:uncharacterized Fe-S cluster-containing radical SAM superfamily enzyme